MKLKEILQLLQNLSGKDGISTAYVCGGSSRDKAIKQITKSPEPINLMDIDLTTGDNTIHLLAAKFGAELKKTYDFQEKKMDDGHTSIFLENLKIDFSSNFITPNIEKILASQGIKNPSAINKEMFSRDFTCNALLMSLDLKKITDPTHKGIADIEKKILNTCLDPHTTLSNNTNRIIRVVYLAAKLDFDVDPEIIKWIQEHKDLVRLSPDSYLTKNLNKAFTTNPERAASIMNKTGLWESVPITENIFPYYEKRLTAHAQVRRNYDYGEGVFQNLDKYKSIGDFRKKRLKKRKKEIQKIRNMKSVKKKKGMIEGLEKTQLLSLASIFSDLVAKYPEYSAKIKMLHDADPTPNKKYLPYAVKQLVSKQALEGEIADVIKLFHKLQPKLEQKDINQWNFTQLRDKLFALRDSGQDKSKRQEKTDIKTSGGIKLYEDDQCVLMRVDTKAAACFYGAGTKWCITMSAEKYYEDYVSSNVVFYFVLRKDVQKENDLYKVAVAVQRDMDNKILSVDCYDATDEQIFIDNALIDLKSGKQIKQIISENSKSVKPGFLAMLEGGKEKDLTDKDYEENMGLGRNDEFLTRNRNTPPHVLAKIWDKIKDKKLEHPDDKDIYWALAKNYNTPGRVIDELVKKDINKNDSYLYASVIKNKNILPETLEFIVKNIKEVGSRIMLPDIARNEKTSLDLLRYLSNTVKNDAKYDEHSNLSEAILLNKNADQELIDELYNTTSESQKHHLSAVSNNLLVLYKILNDFRQLDKPNDNKKTVSEYFKPKIASNPYIDKKIQLELLKSENVWVRKALANNDQVDPEILDHLSKDEENSVRLGVAWNSKTSKETLKKLIADPDHNVVSFAYQNPNFAEEDLKEVAKSKNNHIRSNIASLAKSPEILTELAKDKIYWVRMNVARNKHTPIIILKYLLNDENRDVKEEAEISLKNKENGT